jgi:hypothetical protein
MALSLELMIPRLAFHVHLVGLEHPVLEVEPALGVAHVGGVEDHLDKGRKCRGQMPTYANNHRAG